MSQLLDFLMSVFDGIIDWISFIFKFFNFSVYGLIRTWNIITSMFGIVLNLPTYFTWLPAAVLTVLSQCIVILFVIKVIHLIK